MPNIKLIGNIKPRLIVSASDRSDFGIEVCTATGAAI